MNSVPSTAKARPGTCMMKNYARELLDERLNADQQRITQAATRLEWNNRFWQGFIMPALTGVLKAPDLKVFCFDSPEGDLVEHFGQVLPIEDVEAVIDMVDSIT